MNSNIRNQDEFTRVIVAVTVNEVKKSDFYIYISPSGKCLIKPDDLELMGIYGAKGQAVVQDGEPHLLLISDDDLQIYFDEKKLTLKISIVPKMLKKQLISLLPEKQKNVLHPRDSSAFLNYSFNHYGYQGSANSKIFNLDTEIGARISDYLLLSNFSYKHTDSEDNSVRLMSSVVRDWEENSTRLKLGDFFASSGELGSTINMGGVSFAKIYAIDPYFIKRPMAEIMGAVSSPSEAQIYLNGTYFRKVELQPGEFKIQDISSYGGLKNVNVIIKDMFGREQAISQDYYFSDKPLREGLHEYSYNLGLVRQNFGTVSNHYEKLAFSAFHRYGMSDNWTLGISGEVVEKKSNAGLQSIWRLDQFGVLSASASLSNTPDDDYGLATQLAYSYQKGHFVTGFLVRQFQESYRIANTVQLGDLRPKSDLNINFGYGTNVIGTIGANYNISNKYGGVEHRSSSLSYSKSLFNNVNVFATLSHISGGSVTANNNENNVFLGVTWYFDKDMSMRAVHQNTAGVNSDSVQITKNTPAGEGWGYRANLVRTGNAGGGADFLDSRVQYNGKNGIYQADYRATESDDSYHVSVAGAVSYLGNSLNFSRPIYDSFALVKVNDIPGVKVMRNNQIIGSTNSEGKAFIPNLASYRDNQISINDKDVPIEYELKSKLKYVSPPLRGGTIVKFDANRIHAYSGRLKVRNEASVIRPVENSEFKLVHDGDNHTISTIKGGEFYFDNISPAFYKGELIFQERSCIFNLEIPASGESFIDLGDVICEQAH